MCAMERLMMNKQRYPSNTTTITTSSSPISMQKDSYMISKVKPKIRKIHIYAPEIIKTDVANFRELVQRLTGKPTEKKTSRNEDPKRGLVSRKNMTMAKKMEMMRREKIKGEEEIWGGANSGGGFLGGFTDLDGFMQEISQEFIPFIPNLEANSSHLDHSYPMERDSTCLPIS